jgi:hypothetical protein
MLDKIPIADNSQKDEILFIIHSGYSSSSASLTIHTPITVKTAKTTQALKDAISLYIANPISQPRRGTDLLPALKGEGSRWCGEVWDYIPSLGVQPGAGSPPITPTPFGAWGYGFGEHHRPRLTGPEHQSPTESN